MINMHNKITKSLTTFIMWLKLPILPNKIAKPLAFALVFANIGVFLLLKSHAATYSVQFVYFCASDACDTQWNQGTVDLHANEIKSWYRQKVGKEFNKLPTLFVRGSGSARYYTSNTSFGGDGATARTYYNIANDQAMKNIMSSNIKTVVMLGFKSMSNCGVASGSLAISDPTYACKEIQPTVLAHELGHTLLSSSNNDHTTDRTLMHQPLACSGSPLARCELNSTHKNIMENSAWFNSSSPEYDNASCDSVSAPNSVEAGQAFSATIKMFNSGTTTWQLGSGSTNWKLGSSNPRGNTTWGSSRINGSGTVSPGGVAFFTYSGYAPSPASSTNYSFSWEMLRENSYWLKDKPINPTYPTQQPVCSKTIYVNVSSSSTPPSSDPPPSEEPSTSSPSYLTGNQQLNTNDSLVSTNGAYKLVMQSDGNLVMYKVSTGSATWSSGTSGSGGVRAKFQTDGNFVIYKSSGTVAWQTNTSGKNGYKITMQGDGNLVIATSGGTVLWSSKYGRTY